ncbi:MAG: hypothetical protein JXX14_02040 [Deltaproteobacteria bacterium]|nr:hypothetical protein [Deltaproteobacteria bacterium]
MHNASRPCQIIVFISLFLICGNVAAQSPQTSDGAIRPIVVLVSLTRCCTSEAWPEAEEKIRLEFIQGGVDVVVVDGRAMNEADRRAELITIAYEYQAAAAIRILKPPSKARHAGVDLWITDRVTQKTVYRYLPLKDVNSGESSIVAALKTMELFKGSLQEIHLARERAEKLPKSIETLSESPVYPTAARKPFLLGGGFGGIFFARDVGFRGAPMVWLGWSPTASFAIQVEGVFGVMGRDIVSNGSASSLLFDSVLLKPLWVMNRSTQVKPAIGLTIGMAYIQMEGIRSSFMTQKTAHLTSLFLGAETQMSFALTESLWLTPAFDIGFITPQARVLFNGAEVARFGVPILKLSVLLSVHF